MTHRILLPLIGLAVVAIITLRVIANHNGVVVSASGVPTAQAAQIMGLVEHQDENGEKLYSGVPVDPDKQQDMLEGLMEETMNPKVDSGQ